MEEKINIAAILKDKKNGIRLYSPIFGECSFSLVREETYDICVKKHNGVKEFFDSKGLYYNTGEVMLFPSKEMRDWSKLAWNTGDILVNKDGNAHVIFKGFDDDTYKTFNGNYYLENNVGIVSFVEHEGNFLTSEFDKANKENAQTYINTIEERFGGKLNLQTLEIEKQQEFKDGDVVSAVFTDGDEMVCVFKEKIEQDYMGYCGFFSKGKHKGDVIMDLGDDCICNDSPICKEIRLATEEEKQQLFSALANKGKAWDSDKKAIVDLKSKVELKPFDKVVVRCGKADRWSIDFFSYKVHNGYICTGDAWFGYCLPYNDETAHLLGTTDEWKGGEQ